MKNQFIWKGLFLLAILSLAFQLFWFGTSNLRRIDFDGISYIGLARHMSEGDFRGAINAFRSPAISGLMAISHQVWPTDLLLIGKYWTVVALLLASALLFALTKRLSRSLLAASFAVFWFSWARGIVPGSVQFVSPDYLFMAVSTLYFIILFKCFHNSGREFIWWSVLGFVAALAFLIKAFALPWLLVTTTISLILMVRRNRTVLIKATLAIFMPALVATGWATVLHSRYGVWTTGTQFKTNFYQWVLKAPLFVPKDSNTYLIGLEGTYDDYLVGDPIPPGSPLLKKSLDLRIAFLAATKEEIKNLPKAMKECGIVITPFGLLAFLCSWYFAWNRRREYWPRFAFITAVACSAGALVSAYCLLVFDSRYLLPIYPVMIGVASLAILPISRIRRNAVLQTLLLLLVLGGLLADAFYSSSPWRVANRDYQGSCRTAAALLRTHQVNRVVSIGTGPYPERGVGWEASFIAAYLSDARLIAHNPQLPTGDSIPSMLSDLENCAPQAVLIWGSPESLQYVEALHAVQSRSMGSDPIRDERGKEVGTVSYLAR